LTAEVSLRGRDTAQIGHRGVALSPALAVLGTPGARFGVTENTLPMSALGRTRSFGDVCSMSELPQKAEVDPRSCDVAQVPLATLTRCNKHTAIRLPRRRPLVVSERSIRLDESGSRMRKVDRHHECADSRDLA